MIQEIKVFTKAGAPLMKSYDYIENVGHALHTNEEETIIPHKTILQVLSVRQTRQAKFFQVEYEGKRGWVPSAYIRAINF